MRSMSRRKDISVLVAITAALAVAPATAQPKPVDSWGRAGIAYETYRNDSLECGLLGHNADVSQTRQARDFVRATRQMEGTDNANFASPSASAAPAADGVAMTAGAAQAMDMATVRARQYEQIRRSIRPEQRMKELKQGMVGVVEECLRERGYVQFRLTDEQRETLSHLARGSEERREFLYRLASNPDVLTTQALPSAAS
jgi:hypothetical protein